MNDPLTLQSTLTLNNGVHMPMLGLGVWKTQDGHEVVQAIHWALAAGYRLIDTAAVYRNETGVGQALQESAVPREDIFVTSKVWNSHQGYDTTLAAFDKSMGKLGLDYLDLYLIHWPVKGQYHATWRALETLYAEGRVRAIGVSNFQQHHLEDLLPKVKVIPAVNQIEFHPYLLQSELHRFCQQKNIQVEGWSPLMQGEVFKVPLLQTLAQQYGKTVAQIVLRWSLQKGVITIPKSVQQARIIANAELYDFAISPEDMQRIDALDRHQRFGPDPDNFDF